MAASPIALQRVAHVTRSSIASSPSAVSRMVNPLTSCSKAPRKGSVAATPVPDIIALAASGDTPVANAKPQGARLPAPRIKPAHVAKTMQPRLIFPDRLVESHGHNPNFFIFAGHGRLDELFHPMNLPPRPIEDHGQDQRGFTLLELLVVLAILGLLVGLVAPATLRQLGSAKEKIAHQSIERLASVLDIYKLDVGSYPTTEQGLQSLITSPPRVARWNGPYLKGEKVPEDPWGRAFNYRSPSQRPGHEYDLYSLGPSGQAGRTGEAVGIYNE